MNALPALEHRAACALAARTLAWTLLFGGWLALGALGLRHAPVATGALAPVALWLLAIGVAVRVSAAWSPSPRALRVVLVGSAALAAACLAALAHGAPQALWPAAVAWGSLIVAASRVVRGWRRQPGPRLAPPVVPAALGALVAWLLAGDPAAVAAHPAAAAAALAVSGVTLAVLVPSPHGEPRGRAPGCRSGLFDCALAWPTLAQWRVPAHWPWLAAALAMLPMMASLPLLAEGCARAGWSPQAVTGLHLLAMLAPAAVAALRARALVQSARAFVAGLLIAGGVAALTVPASDGTMVAMLLHAAAWGIAWSAAMAPATDRTRLPAAHGGACASALASAAVVLALGVAVAASGWAAWRALHAALGAIAALGVAAAWLRRHPPVFEELRG
ncbi:hypothetical protein MOJ79_08965 [Calidifontimicrobium sp. SYSU G02091]|uniref:hypothetical protein n=1 Tax=Calidifontimicrobium sp. SYSU G02091 TaxID=2926421 RepID=UPI001F53DC8B|nr:hypothetical protein [Calidifontimicrobium sp. SYSU G02091]MCI1191969.1 hypothetical protein [Calidifontimicrobium sp. SYSU G02091]